MAEQTALVKKEYDKNDPNPCSGCSACCEYVALEIDKPTTVKDFDNIFWYLLHKNVWVYISNDGGWYIQFNTECEKLVDRRCSYYHHRPNVCRQYEVESCMRYGDGKEEKCLFRNEIDLFKYIKKRRPAMYKRMKEKSGVSYPLDI